MGRFCEGMDPRLERVVAVVDSTLSSDDDGVVSGDDSHDGGSDPAVGGGKGSGPDGEDEQGARGGVGGGAGVQCLVLEGVVAMGVRDGDGWVVGRTGDGEVMWEDLSMDEGEAWGDGDGGVLLCGECGGLATP